MENIKETYDYSMFHFGAWNRDIKEKNLRRLDKKVKEEGWKKHPIIVNGNMEVVDGQHRLVYAKTHHLPVYYIVVDELTSSDCVLMNNTRAAWTMEDFIKLHSSEGNENFIRLQELVNEYTFVTPNTLINIIKGRVGSGTVSSKVKAGNFVITAKECKDIKQKLNFLQELSPYVKSAKGRAASLYNAISFCYDLEGIDRTRLKKQIKTRITSITPPVDTDTALHEIEYIYNYKIAKADYVYIFTEYKKHAKEQMLKGSIAFKEKYGKEK